MIVVDASALIDVLLRSPAGGTVEPHLFGRGQSLHAPHLIDAEAAHVFRRLAARGDITETRGASMLAILGDMRLRRYAHIRLLPRVWELRANVSAYDALYVALAEALAAPLLTRDRKLAKAVERIVQVRMV